MSINLNKTTNYGDAFNELNYADNSSLFDNNSLGIDSIEELSLNPELFGSAESNNADNSRFFDNSNLGIDTIEGLSLNSSLLDSAFFSSASDETLPVELQNLFVQEFGVDNPFDFPFQAPGPNAMLNIEEMNTEGMVDLPADLNNINTKQANLNSTEMTAPTSVHPVKKRKTRIKIMDTSFKLTKTNESGSLIEIKDIEHLITKLDPKYFEISNYFSNSFFPFYHENNISLLHVGELKKKDIIELRDLFNKQSDEEKKSWNYSHTNYKNAQELIEKEYTAISQKAYLDSLKSLPIELQNQNREENQMGLPPQIIDEMNLGELLDLPPGIANPFELNSEQVNSTSMGMQASNQNLQVVLNM